MKSVRFSVGNDAEASALLAAPASARACYVLAHGAGAGMTHPFLERVAQELEGRGVASFRYQFPYMQEGRKRPDSAPRAEATVREAVRQAGKLLPGVALVAGGKSFGGRMTSQAQAAEPLPEVEGLAFLGFPLHPPGAPSAARGEHLARVQVPMLFLQGTRDEFASLELLSPLCQRLGDRARLVLIEGGDHSFRIRGRGRDQGSVYAKLADALACWIDEIIL
jgi:predicted alpha/beta-hydrolase family hydrolase